MSRSLDDMTASELNDAIDDTNFPKPMPSPSSCSSIPTQFASPSGLVNGHKNHVCLAATHSTNTNLKIDLEEELTDDTVPTPKTNGHKQLINREHPTPLKMVAFKEDSIDVPGTPRTPRTSTTPGTLPLMNVRT